VTGEAAALVDIAAVAGVNCGEGIKWDSPRGWRSRLDSKGRGSRGGSFWLNSISFLSAVSASLLLQSGLHLQFFSIFFHVNFAQCICSLKIILRYY